MKGQRFNSFHASLLCATLSLWVVSIVSAAPTDQEFFKSVRDNLDQPVDGTKLFAVAMGVVAIILLLVVITRKKEQRISKPKALNHPGKLIKEIAHAVHLKPAEVKQLKLLSDGQNVSSPIMLLLCPSVFAKAVRAKTNKVDRKVLAQIAKKLVQPEPVKPTQP